MQQKAALAAPRFGKKSREPPPANNNKSATGGNNGRTAIVTVMESCGFPSPIKAASKTSINESLNTTSHKATSVTVSKAAGGGKTTREENPRHASKADKKRAKKEAKEARKEAKKEAKEVKKASTLASKANKESRSFLGPYH